MEADLADKFNDLSSIHFSTPQFSYVPSFLRTMVRGKKSRLDELIKLKKKAVENIINPSREKIEDLIEFKKGAIEQLVNPDREVIEDLIDQKREEIAELGASFPGSKRLRQKLINQKTAAIQSLREKLEPLLEIKTGAIEQLVNPDREVIEGLIDQKRVELAELGASFPGSKRLRQKLRQKLYEQLEPFKQAYQGLRDGLTEEIELVKNKPLKEAYQELRQEFRLVNNLVISLFI